jgi:mannonate dehydratase
MKDNRRDFIKKSASLAAAVSVAGLSSYAGSGNRDSGNKTKSNTSGQLVAWPVMEGPNTPKLCIGGAGTDAKQMQTIKQMGVDYIIGDGGPIPWKEADIRASMNIAKNNGLTIINMMISGFNNAIYGREGRDADIEKVKESLIAAGAAGLPVVEYNWYADRFMEGYYAKKGRGGSGITAFDYSLGKDLPAKPEIGTYTARQLWDNLTYFLKAVIPVAEKAGVRMALHPNDPGVPISHGSAQIIATFDDWKRLITIIDSPSNGMTYDCGVCCEMGYDPLEVLRYLGTRDRINHMHYRNVTVQEPHVRYEEVFFDTGVVNMLAVMQEVFKVGYKFGIYPEHPRFFTRDAEYPGYVAGRGYAGGGGTTGQIWNVAYARAMMQAVQSL